MHSTADEPREGGGGPGDLVSPFEAQYLRIRKLKVFPVEFVEYLLIFEKVYDFSKIKKNDVAFTRFRS